MSSLRSGRKVSGEGRAVALRGEAPPPASKLPPLLRFPLLVVLNLSISSLLYSLSAVYLGSENDLAKVSRKLDSWSDVASLVGWKT